MIVPTSSGKNIVAKLARIPSRQVNSNDKSQLQSLEKDLKLGVFGQDNAVDSLSTAIKLSRSGLSPIEQPMGSFLFAGPTGVGKTEICKQLSRIMGVKLLRFDMSEYMERHSISKLIGSPPGYVGYDEGGLLTEAVNSNPYAVLLLDEIEKAHPDIFNLLLQVMDHGMLTDANGREVDFRNVILVMTSNVGARKVSDFGTGIGFASESNVAQEKAKKESIIKKELKNKFSPEFLNRLDDIILFDQLKADDILKIVDIELAAFSYRMSEEGYTFKFNKNAKVLLSKEGYDKAYGARPIKRAVQKFVEDIVADGILEGTIVKGGSYTITKDKSQDKLIVK